MEATAALVEQKNVTVASILHPGWTKKDFYFIALHTVMSLGVRLRETGALLISSSQETMEKIQQAIFPPGENCQLLIADVMVEKSSVVKMEMLINRDLGIAFDHRFVREESGQVTSFRVIMVDDAMANRLIAEKTTLDYY
ncbi:MAG TPA: hypothetical protein VMD74_01585 [Candidatus Methylomirabilis sp.]|nr:hypothetical protein [Candidatus Methylomirabilis sp.]